MAASKTATTLEPTKAGAKNLAAELRLYVGQLRQRGSVGIGSGAYYVYLWAKQRKPEIDTWDGVPVIYRIGAGRPVAL